MIESDRIISADGGREDEALDRAIRPKMLADYVGQVPVREQMEIFIQASKERNEALDHVLIFGPPGLGKRTYQKNLHLRKPVVREILCPHISGCPDKCRAERPFQCQESLA